ncbi:MAG: AI-2E family transporter [Desulfuromonadales bacterium]|nr:AI-2E family transporter [Desulfuromonadales bacterium]
MIFFAYSGIFAIILLVTYICLPFLPAFVWAFIIYQAGHPLQQRLLRHVSPVQASLLMLFIVVITIIVPISLLGGQLVIEASTAYQQLEEQGFTAPSAESLRQLLLNSPLPAPLRDYLSGDSLKETLLVHTAELGKTLVSVASAFLTRAVINIGSFLFSVIAFLFIYFCVCNNGSGWYQKILKAVPREYGLDTLLSRLASAASGLFWGVAGTCLVQGVVGGIIFLFLGLPSPLLIAALISFCALVPVIGTAIIWLPFVLWLAINGAWAKALILALCGVFVIGSIDNITRPLLTKVSGAQLSTLTVTLGAIGGLTAFGLTGLVIGPLVIESFSWLLDRLGQLAPEEIA